MSGSRSTRRPRIGASRRRGCSRHRGEPAPGSRRPSHAGEATTCPGRSSRAPQQSAGSDQCRAARRAVLRCSSKAAEPGGISASPPRCTEIRSSPRPSPTPIESKRSSDCRAGENRTAHIMAAQSVCGELLRRFSHALSHANRGACQGSLPVRSRVDATRPLASFPGPVREARDAIERSVIGRATTPETTRVSSPAIARSVPAGSSPTMRRIRFCRAVRPNWFAMQSSGLQPAIPWLAYIRRKM